MPKNETVVAAGVEKYADRPSKDAVRSEAENVAAENRVNQTDQIADYHKDNPTLDATGPQFDPDLALAAVQKTVAAPKKADVEEHVEKTLP